MVHDRTIFFFRHGETDWNAQRRMQGRADRPLNDTGRQQARAVATALAGEFAEAGLNASDFDFVSSPLSRAQETMAIVAAAMDIETWHVEPGLIELDYGAWEGMTSEEIKVRFPEERRRRRGDRWGFRPHAGESFADVEVRVEDWLSGVARPTVAAVHAGIIRVLMKRAGRLAPEDAPRWPVPQGHVFRLDGVGVSMIDGDSAQS